MIVGEFMMNLMFQRTVTGSAALLASFLIAACGSHSTNPSTETFTVYEDAPKMSLLFLGAPGNSLGDVYHFSAALHSERGGPVTGELVGSKTLVKMPTDANPTWRSGQRSCSLRLATAGTKSLPSELPIMRRPLLNSR